MRTRLRLAAAACAGATLIAGAGAAVAEPATAPVLAGPSISDIADTGSASGSASGSADGNLGDLFWTIINIPISLVVLVTCDLVTLSAADNYCTNPPV